MRNLRRNQRDFSTALLGLVDGACTIATALVAGIPSEHGVTAEEVEKVETFVASMILDQARTQLANAGAGHLAFAFAEGPGVRMFRDRFSERLRSELAKREERI